MNIKNKAMEYIYCFTSACISGVEPNPTNSGELYDTMVEEISYNLTNDFIEGKLSPMEYNSVRNDIARILWAAFEKAICDELRMPGGIDLS